MSAEVVDRREALGELAPTGTVRIALNVGNPAIVSIASDGTLTGPAPRMAEALARWTEMPIQIERFSSAADVIAASRERDGWDLAFLAIDPRRANLFHFSPPYLSIEAAIAVWADSPLASLQDLDRPGIRLASSEGAAYDLHLQRVLQHAQRVPFSGPQDSLEVFEQRKLDAVAAVRQLLEKTFEGRRDIRLLPRALTHIKHALAIPLGRAKAAALLDQFARETPKQLRCILDADI